MLKVMSLKFLNAMVTNHADKHTGIAMTTPPTTCHWTVRGAVRRVRGRMSGGVRVGRTGISDIWLVT